MSSDSDVPIVELIDDNDTVDDAAVGGDRRSPARTLIALVVGAVVLAIVLSVLASRDDDPEGAEDPPTTEDVPQTTASTQRANPTTSEPPATAQAGREALDGFAQISVDVEGMAIVDLGSGSEILVDGPSVSAAGLQRFGDTLVARGVTDTFATIDLSGESSWSPLEIELGPVEVRTSEGMLITDSGQVLAADREGGLRTWTLPASARVFDAVGVAGDVLVLNGYGRIYAVSSDGDATAIAEGVALGVSNHLVLAMSCDDDLRCSPRLLDGSGDVVRMLPPLPDRMAGELMTISPSGDTVILRGWDLLSVEEAPTLLVHTRGGDWRVERTSSVWDVGRAAWAADGTAAWWAADGDSIEVLRPDATWVSVSLGESSRQSVQSILLPLEDLRPTWLEALGR